MELDDAYANGAYIAGADDYPPRWAEAAEAARRALGSRAEIDIAYGAHARETLDLFLPETSPEGLMVFVHGGYWLRFDKSWWSHLAAGALARGWAVAMPSYVLCPEVRIADITQQIAVAVSHAAQRVAGPIALAGHSAGGHLVSRMLAPGMLGDDVAARLRHVMPISPLSDLRPLLRTSMNREFKMTPEMAAQESPLSQPAPEVPVTVWVGADERPSFLDQAQWLAEKWDCAHVVAPGKHHFDVIDELSDAESDMVQRLLA